MHCVALGLPGCFELCPRAFRDARGTFVKSYREDLFQTLGLRTDWREEFFTTSSLGVIRGMHFQVPPAQQAKLVTCIAGEALDVMLDLRPGATYGRWITLELSGEKGNAAYIPEGIAHGFLAKADGTTLHYKVTSLYSPGHDQGLRWDSFGFQWPEGEPLLSGRDEAFPAFAEFQTPFES